MTKSDLIREVSEQTGKEPNEVRNTLEATMKIIKKQMIEGKNIYLRGFGSFIVKTRAEKVARNIGQGTEMVIPATKVPAFKPSKEFKKKVSSKNHK